MVPVRTLAIFPFLVLLFFAITGLFQWLWNITMPEVFNFRKITFWQALRLLLLAGLLFGGVHFTGR
ncbi:hypothetical protein [Moorella sulfitireducens (nom. illeg.)]|uniref:hypothetical protein n=1 Tax=Neomoorella sulfitireducens TaxID=2972948 RepID=UPI0021ACC73B|nr:hypothetical protein [Moorella sulfitireducens]